MSYLQPTLTCPASLLLVHPEALLFSTPISTIDESFTNSGCRQLGDAAFTAVLAPSLSGGGTAVATTLTWGAGFDYFDHHAEYPCVLFWFLIIRRPSPA